MLDEYQRRIESGESEKNSEVALQSAAAVPSKVAITIIPKM